MTWPNPPNYYETPTGSYKVLIQQPQWPIVNPDPSLSEVVVNMRPASWGITAGLALFGATAGYYKGSKVHWQKPAMYFGALFFGKTGLLMGLGDSAYRLMGYRENAREVANNLPATIKPEAY